MGYVVFALKWRPQNFDEIVGQDHIVITLKSALQKNRLAHAYLFAGPRGVGKTSTARILARALNCKNGPTVNPCGKCTSCIQIIQGRSLDVIEIDGASNRGIDEIRTLRENVKFAPTQGKYKIYIIDEVHQITPDGFNALLKTLEEPPDFVKFVFATTQPHKVIPTILSRCHRLDFRRISNMEIIGQLERIVDAEKVNIDKEVLIAITRSCDGSLRDAESILDQLISFAKDKVSLSDVISMLGLVQQETLFEITDKIIQKNASQVLSLFDEIINQGKDPGLFLQNLIEHFRNLMIAKITQGDSQLIDLPSDACKRLLQQSKDFSLEEIFSAFNILVNAQEMSKRLESLRIPLEIGLVRLVQDKKGQSFNLAKPEHPQEKKESSPEETSSIKIEPVQSIPLDKIKDAWSNIIDNISRIKMSTATYLKEGYPIKLEDNILTISSPNSLHKESLERTENKTIIERILSELFNTKLRVNFMLSKEMPQKEDAQNHPFIKSILETFNGKLIEKE